MFRDMDGIGNAEAQSSAINVVNQVSPSREQQQRILDLYQRAYNTARTYDGTAIKRKRFQDTITDLYSFISTISLDKESEAESIIADSIKRGARATSLTMKELYDVAFNTFLPHKHNTPTDMRRLLQFLAANSVEIDTMPDPLHILSGRERVSAIGFQPNVATVLRALFDHGYSVEDINFAFLDSSSPAKLNISHTILTLPDRKCQIVVSDLETRDIYVSTKIKSLKYWQGASHEQLKESPHISVLSDVSGHELHFRIARNLPDVVIVDDVEFGKELWPQFEGLMNGDITPNDIDEVTVSQIPYRMASYLAYRRSLGYVAPRTDIDPMAKLFADIANGNEQPEEGKDEVVSSPLHIKDDAEDAIEKSGMAFNDFANIIQQLEQSKMISLANAYHALPEKLHEAALAFVEGRRTKRRISFEMVTAVDAMYQKIIPVDAPAIYADRQCDAPFKGAVICQMLSSVAQGQIQAAWDAQPKHHKMGHTYLSDELQAAGFPVRSIALALNLQNSDRKYISRRLVSALLDKMGAFPDVSNEPHSRDVPDSGMILPEPYVKISPMRAQLKSIFHDAGLDVTEVHARMPVAYRKTLDIQEVNGWFNGTINYAQKSKLGMVMSAAIAVIESRPI